MLKKKIQKIKTKNFGGQKGSSLLFTILIMSFVMGISFGVSYILFQEIKMSKDIGDSVVAFYAAESGIEKLMMNQANPSGSAECFVNPYSDVCYETMVYAPGDAGCPSGQNLSFCLQSTGSYGNTKRAIQIQY